MLKQIILAVTLLVCVILPSKADTELLAHWTFDRIENNMIKDVAGNNDGAISGKWQESNLRPGLYGNALHFGDMASLNKITLKSTASLSLTDDFTVECIIKPENVGGYRTIIWKGNRSVNPEAINYDFDIRDGKPEMKFKDEKGKWTVYSTSKAVLEAGQWYQLIFTKDNGNVDIYVNGERHSVNKSEDGKGINLLPNEYNAYIGAGASHTASEAYLFHGLIDDIKIYRGINVNIPDDFQSRWQRLLTENKKQTELFDEMQAQLEAERKEKLHQEYAAFFRQQVVTKDAPFLISVLPATERLVKAPDFFNKLESLTKTAHLSAARNEYEGFNIIVLGNPAKDIHINEINVSDLVNTSDNSYISASNITCGYVKDVTTADPDIPVDFVGAIPDVIMNGVTAFDVQKDSFTPVFVKVYTGNAAPGIYKGTVELKGEGQSEKVDIYLQVYDFTLPKKGSLRTAFSFFDSFYKQWYGIDKISDEQRKYIHNFLLEYRLSPNNIYSNDPIYPDVDSLKAIKDRTNFFTIDGYGNSKPVSDEVLAAQLKTVGETIGKVKQMGLLDDLYYYSYDEISGHATYTDPEKLAAAKQINLALQKAYPDLRLMQTSPPEEDIEDLFNVWVPLINYFGTEDHLKTLDRLRKRGDEIWWYATKFPTKPYPNFFLDYPVFDSRIIPTLSYMYNVDGILYWCINREWLTNMDIRQQWPNAQWKPYTYHIHVGTKVDRHGMGNFIYPGPSGELLPSLRLENLRDGLEDYEYLKQLDKCVRELEAADKKDSGDLLKEATGLLKVPASVAISVDKWSSDPANLIGYRNHIGKVISKIHAKLKHKNN